MCVRIDSLLGTIGEGRQEEGEKSQGLTSHAAEAVPLVLVLLGHGVGERQARRSVLAPGPLVDMGGGLGRGRVLALEAGELDVVADQVEVGVDAEGVVAAGAGEATREGDGVTCAVDDLVRGGIDVVRGGEVEDRVEDYDLLVVLVVGAGVEEGGGGAGGGEEEERCNCGGFHGGWMEGLLDCGSFLDEVCGLSEVRGRISETITSKAMEVEAAYLCSKCQQSFHSYVIPRELSDAWIGR